MGWEYQWDDKAHSGLKDTEFSFKNYAEAQQRLADYQHLSDEVEQIGKGLSENLRAAWFEMVQMPVQGACQMNRKFLMAQLNHELLKEGRQAEANWAAHQMELAYDSINALNRRYNEQLDGKWHGMMALSTSFTPTAQFYQKPEVTYTEGAGEKVVDLTPKAEPLNGCYLVALDNYAEKSSDARLVKGLGYDWQVMQLGEVSYTIPTVEADAVDVFFYTVPFWPLYAGQSNRVAVSIDGGEPQVFENKFAEYSRTWKDQVMRNGAPCRLHFAIDKTKRQHTVSFRALDAGQMLQRVIIDWGGLQPSYIGPRQ